MLLDSATSYYLCYFFDIQTNFRMICFDHVLLVVVVKQKELVYDS